MGVKFAGILEFFFWEWPNPLPPPTPNFCVVAEMDIIHMIIHLIFLYKQNIKVKTSFKKFQKENSFKIRKIKNQKYIFLTIFKKLSTNYI